MSQSIDREVSDVDETADEIILTAVDKYGIEHQLTYSTDGEFPELLEHSSGKLGTHLSDIYDNEQDKLQEAVDESSKVGDMAQRYIIENYSTSR